MARKQNKKKRGFAALKESNPERLQEIASQGGKAAHISGNAHKFTREEAIKAGRLGGEARGKRDDRDE